jgi:hypothetical protein
MPEDRLARRSVTIAAIGLVPTLVVIVVLALGMTHAGESPSGAAVGATLSAPPLIAFALAVRDHRSFGRSLLLAVTAFVMIGVWYAVLFLPAAAICTWATGGSCM